MENLITSNHKKKQFIYVQAFLLTMYFIVFLLNYKSFDNSVTPAVVLLFLILTQTIFHELTHWGVAKLLKHPSKVSIKEKHVKLMSDLPKSHFILIAIAPLIMHVVMLIAYAMMFPNNPLWSLTFGILIISSVQSDLYLVYETRKHSWNSSFRFKNPGTFEVLQSN